MCYVKSVDALVVAQCVALCHMCCCVTQLLRCMQLLMCMQLQMCIQLLMCMQLVMFVLYEHNI